MRIPRFYELSVRPKLIVAFVAVALVIWGSIGGVLATFGYVVWLLVELRRAE